MHSIFIKSILKGFVHNKNNFRDDCQTAETFPGLGNVMMRNTLLTPITLEEKRRRNLEARIEIDSEQTCNNVYETIGSSSDYYEKVDCNAATQDLSETKNLQIDEQKENEKTNEWKTSITQEVEGFLFPLLSLLNIQGSTTTELSSYKEPSLQTSSRLQNKKYSDNILGKINKKGENRKKQIKPAYTFNIDCEGGEALILSLGSGGY